MRDELDTSAWMRSAAVSTPEQVEERRRRHHALDEITRLLHKQEPLSEKEELMLKAQFRVLKITEDID